MSTLFSSVERTRMTGSRYNESHYPFLNTSAWPSVERVRNFWEQWFAAYPEEKKTALAARFRSSDDHPHVSALLELFMFAVLKQSGYELEVEPPVGDLALEFLTAERPPTTSFYVECTATGRRQLDVGLDALEADLLEAINKTATGRFLLEIQVIERGRGAPSSRQLRADLAAWLSSLDPDNVVELLTAHSALPELIWERDGWRITFGALPTIDNDDGEGAVGMTVSAFTPDQAQRLRNAMDGKASKYGNLGKPLVVVLNSTQFQTDRDLLTALLGDVVWHIDFASKSGTAGRKPNGVLYDARRARNTGMSAAMHAHFNALSFAMPDRPITLTHHPFAGHPLPHGLFPMCEERYFDEATGEILSIAPTSTVSAFFGLDHGWPHYDQDPDHKVAFGKTVRSSEVRPAGS